MAGGEDDNIKWAKTYGALAVGGFCGTIAVIGKVMAGKVTGMVFLMGALGAGGIGFGSYNLIKDKLDGGTRPAEEQTAPRSGA